MTDINKEQTTAVIDQNNAIVVSAEQFYYRVDSEMVKKLDDTSVEVEQTGKSEITIITKGNVLENATDYVEKYEPTWEDLFIFEEQLSDGSFKLFYDS